MDDRRGATYWRKRADDARLIADRAQDQGMQRTLLRMAMAYDRLAGEPSGLDDRRPRLRLVHSADWSRS